MDLFYRGYDPQEPVTSGAKHITAAVGRLALALVNSFEHLPDETWSQIKRLFHPDNLWGMCLVMGGWIVASIIGGPVGLAVNALLLAFGLREIWDRIETIGGALKDWFLLAYYATSDAELEAAGAALAKAEGTTLITLLEFIVTHRVFKLALPEMTKRFPVPEWLRRRYEEVSRKREAKRRPGGAPAEPGKLADAAVTFTQAQGADRIAPEFPTGLAVAGAVGALATVGAIWWAASSDSSSRRKR